jgi:hypothetical protein
MVEIPNFGEDFLDMWEELLLLAKKSPVPWTLIGAHMVALHGWARGRNDFQPSRDADVLVNVRVVADGAKRVSECLCDRGFKLDAFSPKGLAHRFVKKNIRLDILAPDGTGRRTQFFTLGGARTIAVPGGSQALKRSRTMGLRVRGLAGAVPVPELLGALLIKIRAIGVDDQPETQRHDVAFLLSLIDDPEPLISDLSGSELRWLRRHPYFADPGSDCYQEIASAVDAATAFRRIASLH